MRAISALILFGVMLATNGCAISEEYRARKAAIDTLSSNPAKGVRIIGDYKDGGSSKIEVHIEGIRYELYVDSRIDTRTPAEVYDRYPADRGAIMLDPDSELAISIKKQYATYPY